MTEPEPLIEVEGVTFGYGREVVLDDVSMAIRREDFLAIIGPNGGGKTTLIKVILGLLHPWQGRVRVRVSGRKGALGYVPQFGGFEKDFPLRVLDMVKMGRLGLRGLSRRYSQADSEAAREALRRFGLSGAARTYIGDLSGGQLQRALIARALVCEPEILILDEPMASIDTESREILLQTLRELNRTIPIVLVTHDLTPFAPAVKQIACINRQLHYHPHGELTLSMLEKVYGCPVELIAHGVPHRVLGEHDRGSDGPAG